jgi:mono/diheme cytochrome c family protein
MGDRIEHGRPRPGLSLLAAFVLAMAALGLAACGGGDGTATSASVRAVRYPYARGLFREMCAGCHALADAGAHGDRVDLDASQLLRSPHAYERALDVISYGRRPGMPAWVDRRGTTEVGALARYVVAVAGKSDRSGDGQPSTALTPVENREQLRRNPYQYGKALFKEICAGCHTLADAGAHGEIFDLDYNFRGGTLTKARLRVVLRGEIEMPDWTKWLSQEEIDALVAYVPAVAGKHPS